MCSSGQTLNPRHCNPDCRSGAFSRNGGLVQIPRQPPSLSGGLSTSQQHPPTQAGLFPRVRRLGYWSRTDWIIWIIITVQRIIWELNWIQGCKRGWQVSTTTLVCCIHHYVISHCVLRDTTCCFVASSALTLFTANLSRSPALQSFGALSFLVV